MEEALLSVAVPSCCPVEVEESGGDLKWGKKWHLMVILMIPAVTYRSYIIDVYPKRGLFFEIVDEDGHGGGGVLTYTLVSRLLLVCITRP